jgi:hypothetical protein
MVSLSPINDLPRSDAIRLSDLDMKLLQFQKDKYTKFVYNPHCSTFRNFFTDYSRAGVYFADQVKFGELAEAIVKVLCRRYAYRCCAVQRTLTSNAR